MTDNAAPEPVVITSAADLADAVVKAFVDGDAATRQHIVDTLGDRKKKS